MKTKIKVIWTLTILLDIVICGVIGGFTYDNILHDDLVESINICEEDKQILRMYKASDGDVVVECFGELPNIDVHVGYGE